MKSVGAAGTQSASASRHVDWRVLDAQSAAWRRAGNDTVLTSAASATVFGPTMRGHPITGLANGRVPTDAERLLTGMRHQ